LKYALGLDNAAAKELFGELVANNVVTAPDSSGMSRVVATKFHQHFGVAKANNALPPTESVKPVANQSDFLAKDALNTDSIEPEQGMQDGFDADSIEPELSDENPVTVDEQDHIPRG
jgi:hypothetical protein